MRSNQNADPYAFRSSVDELLPPQLTPEATAGPEPVSPPRRHCFRLTRFSLRFLLVIVTVIAIWLGVVTNGAGVQRRAAWIVHKYGGEVEYDWEDQKMAGPQAPRWLQEFLGDHYFQRLVSVRIWYSGGTAESDEVADVLKVQSLERLYLIRQSLSDHAFDRLVQLPNLRELALLDTDLTDAQLLQLASKGLTRLDLRGTRISREGAVQFRHLNPDCSFKPAFPYSVRYTAEWFGHFDKDGDSQLNEAEWLTLPIKRLPAHPAGADFNGNGFIDVIEYANWIDRVRRDY